MGDLIPIGKARGPRPDVSADPEPSEAAPADPPLTREQKRSRRPRAVRAKTVSVKRMTKRELELGRLLLGDTSDLPSLPETRGDCANGSRPCPFVSCVHHLYLDVGARTGAIKFNYPDCEPWELTETCALDVADRGGATLEEVGALMNYTRERSRQVEVVATAKLASMRDVVALREYTDGGDTGKRSLPLLPDGPLEDEDERAPGEGPDGLSSAWRLNAIRERLAEGEATLTEVRIAGRYPNRASARQALLDLVRLGHVCLSAPGVYRWGSSSLRLVESKPAEPVSVESEACMESMPDQMLSLLRGEARTFSCEELREATGSASTGSVQTQLGRMLRLGLVVRPSPGQYAAKEHADAVPVGMAAGHQPMAPARLVAELRYLATQRREQAERIDAFIADLWPESEVA